MIQLLALLFCINGWAESAPPAEYPYPERQTASDDLGIEKPTKRGNRGEYYYNPKKKRKKKKPYSGVQQPYKIGSDGTYYYSDDPDKKEEEMDAYDGVEQPVDRDSQGGYYYSRKKKKKKSKVKIGEQPSKINSDGSYIYSLKEHATKNTFSLRFGMAGAPEIKAANGTDFSEVYGSDNRFLISFEYDWKLSSDLYLKLGSGLTSTQGQGQFASGNGARQPKESFQFFIFPNTLSLSYKFQIWDIQMVTPYVEAGPGYFTFVENRSDGDIFSFNGKTTKYGGALTATATAGLLISMSRWTSGTSLMSDYGATQSWLDIQYKQVFGLDSRKDFSSNMITAGLAIGF